MLIEREKPLQQLTDLANQAAKGRGAIALVAGEAFKAVSGIAGACRNHPDHPIYEAYLCWAQFRSGVDKGGDRDSLAKSARATAEDFLLGRRPWPNALVALALLCSADSGPDSHATIGDAGTDGDKN